MGSSMRNWAVFALLGATAVTGCADNKNAIAQGRRAAQRGNYEEAHKHFDEALAKDAVDYNALWGKADVYRRQNDLAKEGEMLERIAAKEDLLTTYGGVVKPAMELNYRKQAEVAAGNAPDKVEGFLRKALEINKKGEANLKLVELIVARASEAMKAKKYDEAIKEFEAALALRMARKQRVALTGQVEIAKFMRFKASFAPRWDAVRPELVAAGLYDEKTDTIFVEAEVEVEGKPGDEGYEAEAERVTLAAVTENLINLTFKVAGKERPEGARVAYSAALVSIVSKGFSREADKKTNGAYKFRISLPFDAMVEKVALIDEGKFSQAAEENNGEVVVPEGEDGEGEAPAAPGSAAGSAPDSAPASAPASAPESAPASAP